MGGVQEANGSVGVWQPSRLLASALTRRDAAAAAALYADDGRLLTSAEQLIGRKQIEGYWQAGITLGLSHVELTPTEVRVDDRVAVEVGRYELTLDSAFVTPATERGSYFVLHHRDDDGSWRRLVDLFNIDPATAPGPELLEDA